LFIEGTFNSFEIPFEMLWLAWLGAIVRGEQEMTRGGPLPRDSSALGLVTAAGSMPSGEPSAAAKI
jgi:hypothetical protein